MRLSATYGKNGLPELPAVMDHGNAVPYLWDHIATGPLAVFFVDPTDTRKVTRIAIACKVSDADLRDN